MLAVVLLLPYVLGAQEDAHTDGQVALSYPPLQTYADIVASNREGASAQSRGEAKGSPKVIEIGRESWTPNPKAAALWGLLPGGGQIYNRKYWKLPIVWGAMMTCYYTIQWNHSRYEDYHAAYRDLKSENPAEQTSWLAFAPKDTKPEDYQQMSYLIPTLKRGNDYFRRYRDISIVAGLLVYGLSILDAYVDAELYTFDISPDLSMRVHPVLQPMQSPLSAAPYQMGVACSFNF